MFIRTVDISLSNIINYNDQHFKLIVLQINIYYNMVISPLQTSNNDVNLLIEYIKYIVVGIELKLVTRIVTTL